MFNCCGNSRNPDFFEENDKNNEENEENEENKENNEDNNEDNEEKLYYRQSNSGEEKLYFDEYSEKYIGNMTDPKFICANLQRNIYTGHLNYIDNMNHIKIPKTFLHKIDGTIMEVSKEIDTNIYIGNKFAALEKKYLVVKGVSHILNLSFCCENCYPNIFTYKKITIDDNQNTNIKMFFDECFDFIDNSLKNNYCKILIHCNMGVSRSATIVIAYLMKKYDIKFCCSYNIVKRCRYKIFPNKGFLAQLKEYEKELESYCLL